MKKKTILLIDDEVDLVNLYKMRLDTENYYVLPLYTSVRSLEVAKREKPDLILTDINMPDKNGYEVCKEIKSDPETKHIPVLLFTATPDEIDRIKDEYKKVGAVDYILKPFDPEVLVKKIHTLLKNK